MTNKLFTKSRKRTDNRRPYRSSLISGFSHVIGFRVRGGADLHLLSGGYVEVTDAAFMPLMPLVVPAPLIRCFILIDRTLKFSDTHSGCMLKYCLFGLVDTKNDPSTWR
jgi:hypothetical protein